MKRCLATAAIFTLTVFGLRLWYLNDLEYSSGPLPDFAAQAEGEGQNASAGEPGAGGPLPDFAAQAEGEGQNASAGEPGAGATTPLSKLAQTVLQRFFRTFNLTEPQDLGRLTIPAAAPEDGCIQTAFHELMLLSFSPQLPQALQQVLQETTSGLKVNVEGQRIPVESHWGSCVMMMFSAAVSLLRGESDRAVEYGTMMGYSTRCIAAGVALAMPQVPDARFFAFDLFNYLPIHKDIWKESDFNSNEWIQQLRKPARYQEQVRRNVLPFSVSLVRGPIGTHSGSVGNASYWGRRPASFFAVDASKDHPFFKQQMALILPWVEIGSVIVLGDSLMEVAMCYQVGFMLGALEHAGYARFIYFSHQTSHTFWEVRKPITPTAGRFKFSSLNGPTWDRLWSSFAKRMGSFGRHFYGEEIGRSLESRFASRLERGRKCTRGLS